MRECGNAELRDLLPDYAHGALPAAERARVEAHLATCGACRAELNVVRSMIDARPRAATPDVARIAAALPRPRANAEQDVASLDAHRMRRAAHERLPWRRVAGVAAVLIGVAGVSILGRRGSPVEHPVVPPLVADSASRNPDRDGSTDTPRLATPRTMEVSAPAGFGHRANVGPDAVGALGGVVSGATDDELEAIIGALDSLSGIPEVEALEGEASVRGGGDE